MLVDDKELTFNRIFDRICDEIKQQPRIVLVYWSLECQMYSTYVNNQQCEGPELHDAIKK